MRFTRLWLVRGCSEGVGKLGRVCGWAEKGEGEVGERHCAVFVGMLSQKFLFTLPGKAANMICFQESRCFNPHLNV
jgi:hypothetical protein